MYCTQRPSPIRQCFSELYVPEQQYQRKKQHQLTIVLYCLSRPSSLWQCFGVLYIPEKQYQKSKKQHHLTLVLEAVLAHLAIIWNTRRKRRLRRDA